MGLTSFFGKIKAVFRYKDGSFFYSLGGKTTFSPLSQEQKLNYMLNNPALAKIVFLNCDVFSLAQIKRKDGKEDDPLLKLLKNPNKFQTTRQFLWTYRFWLMFGNAYLLPYNKRVDSDYQQMYWLESYKIDWGKKTTDKLDKFIFSKESEKEVLGAKIKYKFNDGSVKSFELGELLSFQDLTNGLGNWFRGNSRIDPLWKILYNTESALDAKNINLEFSRKFLISGNYDPSKNLNDLGTMQDVEKEDINRKLRGNNPVLPIKSKVDIERFVNDLASLKLDDAYNEDLSKIGGVYNVPSDIIEALKKGATYENQEKSIGRHINYSEMPKAQDFLESLCIFFKLNADDYEITFNDNSFMQVFEKDRAIVNMTNARTLKELVSNGADPNEAAEFLGIDLKFKNKPNGQGEENPVE